MEQEEVQVENTTTATDDPWANWGLQQSQRQQMVQQMVQQRRQQQFRRIIRNLEESQRE
jgi:hypothetical protein